MVEWKTLHDMDRDTDCKSVWDAAQSATSNLYAMYRSPEWLSCHSDQERGQISIAVHRGGPGSGPTMAFLARRTVPLRFQFSRSREIATDLCALELLGGDFAGDPDVATVTGIVEAAWSEHPGVGAIYLKSVTTESSLWKVLELNRWVIGRAPVYMPDAVRPFHYAELPPTHEEYMKGFGTKQRFTLKKKIRKINEAFPGKVEMRRVTDPPDLAFLTTSARQVIANSWKAHDLARAVPESIENEAFLGNVAARGLLRAHVLTVGGTPCAYIVGYLYNGIYHYADLAYDARFSDHSPGTVLLFLVVEDLITRDQTRFINFGITDAQYKRVFGNRHVEDVALLILRPTPSNRLRIGLHRTFRDAKAFAKRIHRGRTTGS